MHRTIAPTLRPAVLAIQGLLRKTDHLQLPIRSRREIESRLVRQASKDIDRMLPWQAGHGRRTAAISMKLGEAAGLTVVELHHLKLAALLHDIGLLLIPQELFTEPSPFASEAYLAVQNHSRLGAQLLEPFAFLREAAVLIAHHHERWDGSGYPYGIRGTYIPLGARILAIADAFDAIRVPGKQCRESRDLIAARILLVASGTQFDPGLTELFFRLLNKHGMDGRVEAEGRT